MLNKKVGNILFLSSIAVLLNSPLIAHEGVLHGENSVSANAFSHAPIGVMGDHMHKKGKFMFSYRAMNMHMDGMRSGTNDVSAAEVSQTRNILAGETMRMGDNPSATIPPFYVISPVDMDMRMHMFGLMYGLSHKVTLMGMLNYQENEMRLATFSNSPTANAMNGNARPQIGTFTSKTSGIGDTKISAMVKIKETPTTKLHYTLGLSLPTGSIKESGSVLMPNGNKVSIDRLGYPMQLGSGSYDLLSGVTYNGYKGNLGWGAQLNGTFRLNENSQDYRLGNKVEATAWLAKQWKPSISTSVRLTATNLGGIRGRDTVITGGMPLFDANNYGRDEVDLHLGVNLLGQNGALKGHRLAFEIGMPIYEDVDGLQMSNDWNATIAWQKAF
jgi:hypothetical protein